MAEHSGPGRARRARRVTLQTANPIAAAADGGSRARCDEGSVVAMECRRRLLRLRDGGSKRRNARTGRAARCVLLAMHAT